MHMQVEDGLSGARADIQHRAVTVFDRTVVCDARGRQMAEPDQGRVFRRRFLKSGDMFLWNDEDMSRALRMDVFKGKNVIVFMDFPGRNFAANNPAK